MVAQCRQFRRTISLASSWLQAPERCSSFSSLITDGDLLACNQGSNWSEEALLPIPANMDLGLLPDLWLYDGMDLERNTSLLMVRYGWPMSSSIGILRGDFICSITTFSLEHHSTDNGKHKWKMSVGSYWYLHVGSLNIISFMDDVLYCHLIYAFGSKKSKAYLNV